MSMLLVIFTPFVVYLHLGANLASFQQKRAEFYEIVRITNLFFNVYTNEGGGCFAVPDALVVALTFKHIYAM